MNPYIIDNFVNSIHTERRIHLKDRWGVEYAEDLDTTDWIIVEIDGSEIPTDWFSQNCKHRVAAHIYPATDYEAQSTTEWPAFLKRAILWPAFHFENKDEAMMFKLAYGGAGGKDTY